MGADVFAACKENINKKVEDTIQKIKQEEREYLKLKEKVDELVSSSTNIEKFSSNDKLKVILKSLKRNGDPALPTKKKDMLELYNKWKDRKPREFLYPVSEVQADDNNEDPNYDDEELNISAV